MERMSADERRTGEDRRLRESAALRDERRTGKERRIGWVRHAPAYFWYAGRSWKLERGQGDEWLVTATGHRVAFSYKPYPPLLPPVSYAVQIIKRMGCTTGLCTCGNT
jgi:hypothetical protein